MKYSPHALKKISQSAALQAADCDVDLIRVYVSDLYFEGDSGAYLPTTMVGDVVAHFCGRDTNSVGYTRVVGNVLWS